MLVTMEDLWLPIVEATHALYRFAPNAKVHVRPGAIMLITGEKQPALNNGKIYAAHGATESLQEFCGLLQAKQAPGVFYIDAAIAGRVGRIAKNFGLRREGTVSWLVLPTTTLETVASYGLSMGQVHAPAHVQACIRLVALTTQLPYVTLTHLLPPIIFHAGDVALYLASKDGTPVSTLMVVRSSGHFVGIYNMATAPLYQGQGAGTALLAHVLTAERDQGARHFYLSSRPAGLAIYQQLGFQQVGTTVEWLWPYTAS